jgi:hypothetical protein
MPWNPAEPVYETLISLIYCTIIPYSSRLSMSLSNKCLVGPSSFLVISMSISLNSFSPRRYPPHRFTSYTSSAPSKKLLTVFSIKSRYYSASYLNIGPLLSISSNKDNTRFYSSLIASMCRVTSAIVRKPSIYKAAGLCMKGGLLDSSFDVVPVVVSKNSHRGVFTLSSEISSIDPRVINS